MQDRTPLLTLLVLLVLPPGACSILDPDSYALRVGELEVEMIQASFASLPDTVRAGDIIEVSAITDAAWSDDFPPPETKVEVDGNVATITPFDYEWIEGEHVIPSVFHPHLVSIALNQPGASEIRIEGVNHAAAPLTLTKTVWVEGP